MTPGGSRTHRHTRARYHRCALTPPRTNFRKTRVLFFPKLDKKQTINSPSLVLLPPSYVRVVTDTPALLLLPLAGFARSASLDTPGRNNSEVRVPPLFPPAPTSLVFLCPCVTTSSKAFPERLHNHRGRSGESALFCDATRGTEPPLLRGFTRLLSRPFLCRRTAPLGFVGSLTPHRARSYGCSIHRCVCQRMRIFGSGSSGRPDGAKRVLSHFVLFSRAPHAKFDLHFFSRDAKLA